MIKVWGRTNSSNVMKLLWLLDELGLDHERIDAGMAFGRTNTDEYRAMNPYGLVPVLQDGETTLFESNSILRYLCNKHAPSGTIYPAAAADRALVEAWMDAQLATMTPLGIVFLQRIRLPPEQRDDAVLAAAIARTNEAFAVLETRLAKQAWLAGGTMTLADIAFGPFIHRWVALGLAPAAMPGVDAYYRRLCGRPAYVARCAGTLS